MRSIIDSITGEYQRYKALAEGALRQLTDEQLTAPGPNGGNAIATICWHVGGNLRSRFTDFLTSDGEKPWRKREEEFQRALGHPGGASGPLGSGVGRPVRGAGGVE